MCIRDSIVTDASIFANQLKELEKSLEAKYKNISMIQDSVNEIYADSFYSNVLNNACLLYTSDAADERSSVDLGGRRIIKKKKKKKKQREEKRKKKKTHYQEETEK